MYGEYRDSGLIDRMRDTRSRAKLYSDYSKNHQREEQVMHALCAHYTGHGYETPVYEMIDPTERAGIQIGGGVRLKPDSYLYFNGRTLTFEIKFNNYPHFHDFDGVESVFIKCGAIISMCKDRQTYPNGYAIIATTRTFAILTAQKVASYPIEQISYYGGKKCFVIPVDELDWKPWMTPIPPIERSFR